MRIQTTKRIRRIAGGMFLALAVFAAYHMGFVHHAVFRVARSLDIERDVSPPRVLRVYSPRWACGPGQRPYLLVEVDSADAAHLVGTHIRILRDGLNDDFDFGEHGFAQCRGRFKTSLALFIREDGIMRMDGWCDEEGGPTGRFFAAEVCEPQAPSLEQSLAIKTLLKPHLE